MAAIKGMFLAYSSRNPAVISAGGNLIHKENIFPHAEMNTAGLQDYVFTPWPKTGICVTR